MPSFKKKLFITMLFAAIIIAGYPVKAQIPEDILLSIKTGNSKSLAEFFNQNIELVVPESDNVFSKAQAQLIVNEFFSTHTPHTFSVIHQGGKEGAQYVIGNLATNKGFFRVYFLLKKNNGKDYIHQLRIEKQE